MRQMRTILIPVVLAAAAVVVLVVLPRDNAAREKEDKDDPKVVAALTKLGAQLKRDGKASDSPVVGVVMFGGRYEDRDLTSLAGLKSLQRLQLPDTQITDKGVVHLK